MEKEITKKQYILVFIDKDNRLHLGYSFDTLDEMDQFTTGYENMGDLASVFGYKEIVSVLIYRYQREQYPVAFYDDDLLRERNLDAIKLKFKEWLSKKEDRCVYYKRMCPRNSGEKLESWADRISLILLKPEDNYLEYRNKYFDIKYGLGYKKNANKVKVSKDNLAYINKKEYDEDSNEYNHLKELCSRNETDEMHKIYSLEEIEEYLKKNVRHKR